MAKRRPLIGINLAVRDLHKGPEGMYILNAGYARCIMDAGAVPVGVPAYDDLGMIDEVIGLFDGFIFMGGPDYFPEHYGGRRQRTEELMDPARDRFDIALAKRVIHDTKLPVLGICGGQQLINLAFGGRLVQDLADEWPAFGKGILAPHAHPEVRGSHEYESHQTKIEKDTLLAKTLGADGLVPTNSYHHQAVHPGGVGKGLRACAFATDGVIEAIEAAPDGDNAKRFLIGVQWHPERMQDDARQRRLFSALVDAAKKRRG